jgi:hypothetical protein
LAKEIRATIAAVTVTGPFHVLSLAPSELEYTPIEYKKHAEAQAQKVLSPVSASAKLAGVACETLHIEQEHIYQAVIDAASARRCDLIVMGSHGASRRPGGCPRQRDGQSAHALEDPRTRVSVRCSSAFTASFWIADGARSGGRLGASPHCCEFRVHPETAISVKSQSDSCFRSQARQGTRTSRQHATRYHRFASGIE